MTTIRKMRTWHTSSTNSQRSYKKTDGRLWRLGDLCSSRITKNVYRVNGIRIATQERFQERGIEEAIETPNVRLVLEEVFNPNVVPVPNGTPDIHIIESIQDAQDMEKIELLDVLHMRSRLDKMLRDYARRDKDDAEDREASP